MAFGIKEKWKKTETLPLPVPGRKPSSPPLSAYLCSFSTLAGWSSGARPALFLFFPAAHTPLSGPTRAVAPLRPKSAQAAHPALPLFFPSLRPNARPVEARCLFLSSSRCQPGPACQPRRHLFPLAVSKVDSTGKITKPDFSGFLANSHDTEPYKALSPPRSLFFASESIKPNPNFVYCDLWFSPSYLPLPRIATPLRAFSDLENTLGELASSFSSLQ